MMQNNSSHRAEPTCHTRSHCRARRQANLPTALANRHVAGRSVWLVAWSAGLAGAMAASGICEAPAHRLHSMTYRVTTKQTLHHDALDPTNTETPKKDTCEIMLLAAQETSHQRHCLLCCMPAPFQILQRRTHLVASAPASIASAPRFTLIHANIAYFQILTRQTHLAAAFAARNRRRAHAQESLCVVLDRLTW